MFYLIVILILIGLATGIFISFKKLSNKQYSEIWVSLIFLIIQTLYLLLVVIDNSENSETWMFLALTYIPLVFLFFITLLSIIIVKLLKLRNMKLYIYNACFLLIYLILSYRILSIWGRIFNFPL